MVYEGLSGFCSILVKALWGHFRVRYIHIYICLFTYLFVFVYLFVDMYKYICMYMYLHTHTHTLFLLGASLLRLSGLNNGILP